MNIQKIKDIKNTMTIPKVFMLIVAFVLVLSLTLFIVFFPGSRASFIFESMDSDTLYTEIRFIPRNTAQGNIGYFVDELLLGPHSNRYKPLFANGTRALSCFLNEENTLYINLNEKALLVDNESTDTLFACELLKKNVLKNYKHVDTIKVFIMGNLVTEN